MKQTGQEPKIGKTIREDLKQGGLFGRIKKEWRALKQFYLDEERQRRLSSMNIFKRFFMQFYWLFKSLFFHLTPIRRLIFWVALILVFSKTGFSYNNSHVSAGSNQSVFIGGLLMLFLLMLELKDKLIAKDELQSGRAVQLALMPEAQPQIKGWDVFLYNRPANDVGGDLIDYFQSADKQFDLVLGDVAGKGLPAALFMARVQATIRALAYDFSSLSALIEKVNRIFFRDSLRNRFISLAYLRIKERQGQISLVNAGHMPPMIASHYRVRELAKGDPAIGLKPSTAFHEQILTLKEDEVLLVYSDGLSEARNEEDVFWGEQSIKEALRKHAAEPVALIGQALIQSVEEFTGEAPVFDDLSLMLIRRK